jgi:Fe-S-cluster-containing hydrogenase component 2
MNLLQYLDTGDIVKIASGCGTEDPAYIEKLVRLYSLAGVRYFDISARPESIIAARRGIELAGKTGEVFINVSMGIKGDPHADKAKIDSRECVNCGKCLTSCKNEAIIPLSDSMTVNGRRCIGCGQCAKACAYGAVTMFSASRPVDEVVPPLVALGVDSIELHMAGDIDHAVEEWKRLEACFDGVLSAHVNRTMCGDKRLLAELGKIVSRRKPYTITIQADGLSMGGDEGAETTLQAIAISQIIDMAGFPVYIIPSGGTNHLTARYLCAFKVKYAGIAYGTFARNIVKDHLNDPSLFQNKARLVDALRIIQQYIFNEGAF